MVRIPTKTLTSTSKTRKSNPIPSTNYAPISTRYLPRTQPRHITQRAAASSGCHDCSKGLFPSETMQLNPPSKNDIIINSKSSLTATARWDHNPKDTSAGWLVFSRKEKITHIEYPFADFWCWSGRNPKGKFGFFPKEFVVVDESSNEGGSGMSKEGGERGQRSRRLGGVLSGFQSKLGAKGSSGKGKKTSTR